MSQYPARRLSIAAAILFCLVSAPALPHQVSVSQKGVTWARSGDAPVDAATTARLSMLTNQVIAAINDYQTSSSAKRGQVGAQLRQLAQQRMTLLRALLQGQPGLVLRSTIPNGMTQSLPADVRAALEQDVKLDGQIVLVHGEDAHMRNVMNRYYLVTTDAQGRSAQYRLHAADAPDLPGVQHPASAFVGQSVTVRASAIGGELLIAGAQSIEAGSTSGTTSSGSTTIAGAATVSGNQNTLVLTANFADKALSVSQTTIYNQVFGATNSVADYYRQSSNGNVTFSGSMYGPFQLTANSTDACAFQTWSSQLETLAANSGVNVSSYSRRVYVFPTSTCGIGYGTVGGSPSMAWIFRADLTDLFTHEVGHNLGFMHSSTPSDQYGDTSDVMGYSGLALRLNNAPNHVTTGWFSSSWIKSVSASGIFTLDPTETTSPVNPQVLMLPKPDTGDYYFISFRQPIGYDTTLASGYQNLVSIHRGSASMGQYTYLLGVLGSGGTYSDATNGYTFSVNGIGTTNATVSVTTTAAPCTRSAPTVTMTPTSQSAAPGNSIGYQVTVTNNNSSNCAATSFAFNNSIPSGWTSSDSPGTLSLASGASASTTWTVTSASNAAAASYLVSANAYDTSATSSASTVQGTYVIASADSTPPTVSITSPSNGATISGTKVTISANATDNVGVAKVSFYVDGVLMATDTATPYSFTWNLRKVSKGTHTIAATAWDAAGNSATATITVTK